MISFLIAELIIILNSQLSILNSLDFLQQSVGMSPFVHHEEDVADVDSDATGQLGIEGDVAGERIPVAVEGQTDEAVLAVGHG